MRWIAFLLLAVASPAPASPAPVSLLVGARAPAFVRPALNGQSVALDSYRGRIVLLDFWASWCPPCIVEMPHLIALQKHYAGKLQIIGVSMDDSAASAKDVAARFPFNYPLAMGDAKFAERYGGILGLPSLFLIGRDGRIVQKWRGEFKPGELEGAVQAAVR
jgi:peroxiredoxin